MKRSLQIVWTLCIGFMAFQTIASVHLENDGQCVFWGGLSRQAGNTGQWGARFIPQWSLDHSLTQKVQFGIDASFNVYWSQQWQSGNPASHEGKFKPYRLWARLTAPRWEIRLGLQKINFGSAAILRPLMWFDRIDPRDPLQMTDGVYGLLGRIYFLNNANIWGWMLIGNDDPKGWEIFGSDKNRPEFGFRIQSPVPKGEASLTFHHRTGSLSHLGVPQTILDQLNLDAVPEDRIGLDGRWDIGPGVWFEGAVTRQNLPDFLYRYQYQQYLTLGADYTFGLGNGLYVLGENLWVELSKTLFDRGDGSRFSAFTLRYPVGLLDQVSGILYYDWKNEEIYRFLTWQRTYDRWSFYLMGFWNPDQSLLPQIQSGQTFFMGRGFQVMLVLNY